MTKATTLRRASALAIAAITLSVAGGAFAQTATPAKPAAKPAQAQPAAPAQAPAAQQPQQQAPQSVAVPGINSAWTKVCGKDPQAAKEICMITQDFTAETGQPLASAAIREVKDEPTKKFIVSVPVGMLLQPGTRVIIDQQPPLALKYEICFPNGCFAGMDVNADFVTKLKKAQNVTIQALQMGGRTLNFVMPAKDFAKAYDGAPSDPNVVAAERQKLADELQKLAQKKMEAAQPGAAPAAGAAPATPAAPAAAPAPAR